AEPIEEPFGVGSRVLAVSAEGEIAYLDARGALLVSDRPTAPSQDPPLAVDRVAAAAFAPGEPALVVVVAEDGDAGTVELVERETRRRVELARDGSMPRWLP
ncbi:MAG: hypothetical protein M3Y29_05325, partial [Chloroflexota bacterium]|nr:hypothetical protein [Chloroflexota bacterium]